MTTSTDLAVIEEDTPVTPVVPEPLTPAQAKQLDNKIRTARDRVVTDMEKLRALVDEAALGQIHIGLGLRSWTEWAKDALHFTFSFDQRLERKEVAKMLSSKGMSQHAIASMLGVSQKTINRDLDGEQTGNQGKVISIDGRELPSSNPRIDLHDDDDDASDDTDFNAAPRTSVNEDFESEVYQLQNDIQALNEVIEDDRFPKQRKRIAEMHLNTLQDIKKDLEVIIDHVYGDE